jgi:hypothetical protein
VYDDMDNGLAPAGQGAGEVRAQRGRFVVVPGVCIVIVIVVFITLHQRGYACTKSRFI